MRIDRRLIATLGCLVLCLSAAEPALGATLPAWDFTQASDRAGWAASHDLAPLTGSTEGVVLTITGSDPFTIGPARDYPTGQALWLRLKLRSDRAGACQVFYFNTSPSESRSVPFTVPAGQWVEGRVAVPALGPGYRMRIDPPGTSGTCVLGSLRFEARGSLPDFDFTTIPDATEWIAQHDIASLTPTPEGLRVEIGGSDPYMAGPAQDYPATTPLWMFVRLKSDRGGMAQVFYYTSGASEASSTRFSVPSGDWFEAKVRLPALGAGYRLRIDPPGADGVCVLERLRFEPRLTFQAPAWPTPTRPELAPDALTLTSGDLRIVHGTRALGEFEVEVAGQRMAAGNRVAQIGYVLDGQPRWFGFGQGSNATVTVSLQPLGQVADASVGGVLRANAVCLDPDGGRWEIEQSFRLNQAGSLAVTTRVAVDRDRDILYLPFFTLLPGLGTYGTNKTQAILAGVEYLENEPSSSTADLDPPASDRQVPDVLKLTFPLAAVAAQDRYVAIAWNRDQSNVCAVFDTPDRLFNSGAQVMGLLFPGSDGLNREESSLIPYDTVRLTANRSLTASALLLGGLGKTVVPAVQQYASLFGLPHVPPFGMDAQGYYTLAARGWLDSEIRDGDRYRHAVGANFGSSPAADAAMYLHWLADHLDNAALAQRCRDASAGALAQVSPAAYNSSRVGHVIYPAPALVFGSVIQNAASAQQQAASLLGRFQADGSVLYQKSADGLDYGKTHWAPDANGLTASVLVSLFDQALFSGNQPLIDTALRHLRALNKFRDSVPRGAQTWEIPLHTPDILASAYLVRAYTLGYELTGEPDFLAQARYWAWTGVPFVYLSPPTPQPVGVYSTIPVLGATAWVAPNWIGLPVQWCGLVYADALHRLVKHDPTGPWKQVADGIAAAGIQHSYPLDDPLRLGLLPDSYNLRSQTRNGPDINPATVQAPATRMLAAPALYGFAALNRHGLLAHAPGDIVNVHERTDGVAFTIQPWPATPYWILINGFTRTPIVRIDGKSTPLTSPHAFQLAEGRLVLRLTGAATVDLGVPALAAVRIDRVSPQQVKVSWPRRATNAVLEASTPVAGSDTEWAELGPPDFGDASYWVLVEPTRSDHRFYRLRLMR